MSRILRPAQTAEKVAICDRQLREMEAAGLFPRRFLINPSGRGVGHLEEEIDRWIAERAAARELEQASV